MSRTPSFDVVTPFSRVSDRRVSDGHEGVMFAVETRDRALAERVVVRRQNENVRSGVVGVSGARGGGASTSERNRAKNA